VVLSKSVSRESTWVLAKRNINIDPTEKSTKNIVMSWNCKVGLRCSFI
jgi:hypothetical protein